MGERIAQNVGRLAVAYALSRLTKDILTPEMDADDVMAAIAVGDLAERLVVALWAEAPADAETARVVQRVRMAGAEGISPKELLHQLYSSTNRWRGRAVIAKALQGNVLRKRKSGRGWRLLTGTSTTTATLWTDCLRDHEPSPNVLERSPLSPMGQAA